MRSWLQLLCFLLISSPGSAGTPSLRDRLAAEGIVPLPAPPAQDPKLIELGRFLFHDKILSGPWNISCATCHHPEDFTVDSMPTAIGRGGVGRGLARRGELVLTRNTPALYNLLLPGIHRLFWDGHTFLDEELGMSQDLQRAWPAVARSRSAPAVSPCSSRMAARLR